MEQIERIKTKNIGRKFTEDGSVRFFPGNTVISKVTEENSVYSTICHISQKFAETEGADKYAFLPWESFHMTMIQGVCEEDRRPELWSSHLSLDAPLTEVDDYFEKQFCSVHPLLKTEMIFDYIDLSNYTILVRFQPRTEVDKKNLQTYRDEISDKFGIRFPDHDRYGFHISIAYQLWEMQEAEIAAFQKTAYLLEEGLKKKPVVFTLKQPELTFFRNMYYFDSSRIERG